MLMVQEGWVSGSLDTGGADYRGGPVTVPDFHAPM